MIIDPSSGYNKNGIGSTASSGAKVKPQTGDAERTAKTQAPAEGRDSVSLSSRAQVLSRLESAVAEADSNNESRIAEIKQAIKQGTYEVNAHSVAEKMLRAESSF